MGVQLCLKPGPRRRSMVLVRQAAQNQQTLIRNPAKGEQVSESPASGPAKTSCVGSPARKAAGHGGQVPPSPPE
jgi:hypothetical protein